MIERLFNYGEEISGFSEIEKELKLWKNIDIVNQKFVDNGKQILFI